MSWVVENSLTWYQRLCVNVVKRGPVPRHVAIIMDGNRRFADRSHLDRLEGHTRGFDRLADTLQWCRTLGINEVTVYAFSIENFHRSAREVDGLMQLAREKYQRLLNERERLMRNGVCIRVVGNLQMIPADIRALMAEAMLLTRNNTSAYLNVAFAYTARDEIVHAMRTAVRAVRDDQLERAELVDERLLSQCMHTSQSPEPDMIIRTSGEHRFSDFLLWQLWSTNVLFADVLWPDFSIWHLLASVIQYQRCHKSLLATQKMRDTVQLEEDDTSYCNHSLTTESDKTNTKSSTNKFLENLKESSYQELLDHAKR